MLVVPEGNKTKIVRQKKLYKYVFADNKKSFGYATNIIEKQYDTDELEYMKI